MLPVWFLYKDVKFPFTAAFLDVLFTLDSNSIIAISVLKHLVNYKQLNEQMMSYSTLSISYNLPFFCFNSVLLSIFHPTACPIFFCFTPAQCLFQNLIFSLFSSLSFLFILVYQFFSNSHRLLSFTNCMEYWFSVGYIIYFSYTLHRTLKLL